MTCLVSDFNSSFPAADGLSQVQNTSRNLPRRLFTLARRNLGQHPQHDLTRSFRPQQHLRAVLDKLFAVEWPALQKSKHACVNARSQKLDDIIAQAQSAGRIGMVE